MRCVRPPVAVQDRTKAYWAYKELAQFAYPRFDLVKQRMADTAAALEAASADATSRSLTAAVPTSALMAAGARAALAVANDVVADAAVSAWQELYAELVVTYSVHDADARTAASPAFTCPELIRTNSQRGSPGVTAPA